MTVCIAAICDTMSIIGACDRMMTSGDIEFEPHLDSIAKPPLPAPLSDGYNTNQKIYPITNVTVAMTAGDSGLQSQIFGKLLSIVTNRIAAHPKDWISVEEFVQHYIDIYNNIRTQRAQEAILVPFGLNQESFIAKQHEMSSDFLTEILAKLRRFESTFTADHGVEVIFAGIDKMAEGAFKPRLYTIVKTLAGDSVTCNDSVGFAAVGSGARHAESQFMLAGHSPFSPRAETILLTYIAKKRSEIAPGVGEGTDMFNIGPGWQPFVMLQNIADFDLKKVASIYQTLEDEQKNAVERGKQHMQKYLDEFFKNRMELQKAQQTSSPITTTPPPDWDEQNPSS